MKKILCSVLLVLVIVVQSCDPIRYCSFYVVNNCNEDIMVDVLFSDGTNKKDTIKYNKQCSYLMTHGQPLREEYVLRIEFDTIIIKKNGIYSHVNYMDNNVWTFEKNSKFDWKAILTVEPEHFE